ncbi:hypothetical protein C6A85_000000102520 [Mycobacterium sp. ITM-2017-0098]|nr:hypothetical protein C6A85_000000102520 [Mycobacterium sp. ITM-2017-0098]
MNKAIIVSVVLAAAIVGTPSASADGPRDEGRFLDALIDGGVPNPLGRSGTDDTIVAAGYRACDVMDQYPAGSDVDVSAQFYAQEYNAAGYSPGFHQTLFLVTAANYLCQRNSARWAQF